jgi:hypothetical protein
MNIDVKQFEVVKDPQCIRCGICTSESDCPVNETVSISTKKIKNKKLNFSTKSTALIVLVSVFLGVFILNSLGLWETDNSKVKVENINDSSIELIKGSYTFATIEENYDVDVETLARAFNLTGDNLEGMKINVLESAYGGLEVEIGTESIKYFIALYNGVDFYPNYLPSTAVDVLLELGKIDQAFIEESSLYIVEVDSSNKIEVVVEESEEGEGVNGNTTVQDVINQGLTIEQVETILTVEVPNPNLSIKFICDENNLSFGKIKTAISDAIHALD